MRALLEQALTALVQCTYDEEGYLLNPDNEAAIEAIRAELEKPEQEPVAYISQEFVLDRYGNHRGVTNQKLLRFGKPHGFAQCTPLYLAAGAKEKTE